MDKAGRRGNKPGIQAEFSVTKPVLAYSNRKEYNEYFWKGIYAAPHAATMEMLLSAQCLQEVLDRIPDRIDERPEIME